MESKVQLVIYDKEIEGLISADEALQVVVTGFEFIEGPVWDEKRQCLFFSDIPPGILYKWSEVGGVEKVREKTNKGNGNALTKRGDIISCEHGTSCVICFNPETGCITSLATHYNGKELNSPNDVVVRRNGDIYFTDPFFGRNPSRVGIPRPRELDFQGVYKIDYHTKELTLLNQDFFNPNGLCFSQDEKVLYVNDSPAKCIKKFQVMPDGTLGEVNIWATTTGEGIGLPDGMKLDVHGNLYCCAQGGIHIFNQEGSCLGKVLIPEQAANLSWGDKDKGSLYIAATTTVYKIRMKTVGL